VTRWRPDFNRVLSLGVMVPNCCLLPVKPVCLQDFLIYVLVSFHLVNLEVEPDFVLLLSFLADC
jgi:hypothetical protein